MDLSHHGDREVGDLIDFAVNVFPGPRPAWLDEAIAGADLSRYPDTTRARTAIAERHGRPIGEVLPTSGGAEAFTLVARARPWRHPVVVHPQFTEPEAALVAARHTVHRVFDPGDVPEDADLVMVGNPTNPTGVLHCDLQRLLRPGRVLVVDEAFMDAVPSEPESLAGLRREGLLVVRSLTKTWSIPGLRAGYVVGDPAVVIDLEAQQPPWSVSSPALAALEACVRNDATDRAVLIAEWRTSLVDGLPLEVVGDPVTPFVLAKGPAGLREALREEGFAVRRCDTFPGLDGTYIRIAVRPPEETGPLVAAIEKVLGG